MTTHLACYPYGAGHADEGVCLLLEMGSYRILLDCGLRTNEVWNPNLLPADVVLCSHAHGDHARGLLSLRQHFPNLPIYASDVTTQLLPLNWLGEDLSTQKPICQALPWRSPIELLQGLTVELIPAGHLPGAAVILLTYQPADNRPMRVLYTGDFFLSNSRLVEGLRLEELRGLGPDALIIEANYGMTRHPHRRQQENHLMERIDRAITAEQSILLPVPTLGLGQELLFLLRSHHLFSGRGLDVWVHGSIAAACDLYLDLLPSFPIPVQNFARHQPIFWDARIQPRTARLTQGQLELLRDRNFNGKATVILTDSRADLSQFCRSGNWLVLLPESSHHQEEWLSQQKIDRKSNAIVTAETYWLSEHSDGNATLQFIHNLRPQYVLFVHGELEQLTNFTHLDELNSRYKVHVPLTGMRLELPIGDALVQVSAPEARYEGEVAETEAGVAITLPNEVTEDERWRNFADTGIIETYWRGDELVIRGVAAKEMLGRIGQPLQRSCTNCQFYRSRRCSNSASPLFNLQVTPDGYCPSFEELTIDD
jgi:Cft2 family RNA processing exonuclease